MNSRQNKSDDRKNQNCIIGEKCGTVTVSVYREYNSKSPIFYINADTDDVLPISYIIEDALALY